jgi:hypothetical protein
MRKMPTTAVNPVFSGWRLPDDYEGKTLRLIVEGTNSFKGVNGSGPHVVFPFQNIPVKRRMKTLIGLKCQPT